MSNSQRQKITLKEFFDKHHFSSSQTYSELSDNMLKSKLEKHFGKIKDGDKVPDYQLSDYRTHPTDHFNTSPERTTAMLEGAAFSAYEKDTDGFNYDKEGNLDTQSNHDLKTVLSDAKIITDLPFDMESLKNLYQNNLIKLQTQEEFKEEEIT